MKRQIESVLEYESMGTTTLASSTQDSYIITEDMLKGKSTLILHQKQPIAFIDQTNSDRLLIQLYSDKPVIIDTDIIVDNLAVIGKSTLRFTKAVQVTDHIQIKTTGLTIQNDWHCKHLAIETNAMYLSGSVRTTGYTVIKANHVSVIESALIRLDDTLRDNREIRSALLVKEYISLGEESSFIASALKIECAELCMETESQLRLDQSYLKTDEIDGNAASVRLENQSFFHFVGNCTQGEWHSFIAENSTLFIPDDMALSAKHISLLNSKLFATDISLTSPELKIINTTVGVGELQLSGSCEIDTCDIEANKVECRGDSIQFKDSQIDLTSFEVLSEQSIFSGCEVSFTHFTIQGESNWKNESNFVSLSDKSWCSVKGKLAVHDSHFVSCGLFSLAESSKLSGQDACIHAKNIQNDARTSLIDTTLLVDQAYLDRHQMSDYQGLRARTRDMVLKAKATIHDRSQLHTAGLYVYDKTSVRNSRLLFQTLVGDEGSAVEIKDSQVVGGQVYQKGMMQLHDSKMALKHYLQTNQLHITESTLSCAESFWATKNATLSLEESQLIATHFYSAANMKASKSGLHIKGYGKLFSDSTLTITGSMGISAKELDIEGSIEVKEKETEKKGNEQTVLSLRIADSLHIHRGASISGDSILNIHAKEMLHSGVISVKTLMVSGRSLVVKRGKITVEQAKLALDVGVFLIASQVSADHLAIESNFLSLGSVISARKSFTIHGLVSLHAASVIAANRFVNNSLISLSASLVVPNFLDLKSLFNWSSLLSLTQSALASFVAPVVPQVGVGLAVAGLIANCVSLGKSIQAFRQLAETKGLKNLKATDYYRLIGCAANLVKAGFSIFSLANPAAYENFDKPIEADAFSNHVQHMDFGDMTQAAGSLLGGYEENALISINASIQANLVSTQTSLVNLNGGINASGFGQSYRAVWMANGGIAVAPTQSFRAIELVNQGLLQNALHASYDVRTLINQGQLRLVNGSITGESFTSRNQLTARQTAIQVDDLRLTAGSQARLEDGSIETTAYQDAGNTEIAGQVLVNSDTFDHTGHLCGEGSFSIDAPTTHLAGDGTVGELSVTTDDHQVLDHLLYQEGQEAFYHVTALLALKYNCEFIMTRAWDQSYGLYIQALSSTVQANIHSQADVAFVSTDGDTNIEADIAATNIYLESSGDTNVNHTVSAEQDLTSISGGNTNNMGGSFLAGHDLSAQAGGDINNYSPEADDIAENVLPMGESGIMSAGNDLLMQAHNIRIFAATVAAGRYLQGVASGDILAFAGSRREVLGLDPETVPAAANIFGGTGREDGVGLLLQAGGDVHVTASNILSVGSNQVSAHGDVIFDSRVVAYVADRYRKSSWLGAHHKWVITYAQKVFSSSIESLNGGNTVVSEQGRTRFIATRIVSKTGNNISAYGNNEFFSIITQTHTSITKETLGFHSGSERNDEIATFTLLYDEGQSTLASQTGNNNLAGIIALGPGHLTLYSPNGDAIFSRDILNHSFSQVSWSINISNPLVDAFRNLINSDNVLDALDSLSPQLNIANFRALADSNNGYEYTANGINALVGIYNTLAQFSDMMTGNGPSIQQSLASYTSIHVGLTRTETTQTWQTLAQEGVLRGGLTVIANQLIMQNAAQVWINGDINLFVRHILLTGAALYSTFRQNQTSFGVDISITGQVESADASHSEAQSEQTQWANASLGASGNVNLNQVQDAGLHNANITAGGAVTGSIGQLDVTTEQNQTHTSSFAASASTTGNVSASMSRSNSATTGQVSGIHAHDDMNSSENPLHIRDATLTGGAAITTDGVNRVQIGHLSANQEQDHADGFSTGLSTNVNNLAGSGQQSSAIPTATPSVGIDHYEATVTPVIAGAAGTEVSIGEQHGEVSNDISGGRTVERDTHVHVHVDVPIPSSEQAVSSFNNIRQAALSIFSSDNHASPSPPATNNLPIPPQVSVNDDDDIPPPLDLSALSTQDTDHDTALPENMQDTFHHPSVPTETDNHDLDIDIDLTEEPDVTEPDNTSNPGNDILGTILETAATGSEQAFDWFTHLAIADGAGSGVLDALAGYGLGLGIGLGFLAESSEHPDRSASDNLAQAIGNEVGTQVIQQGMNALASVATLGSEAAAEGVAGPVGWALLGLTVADKIIYHPEFNQRLADDESDRFDRSGREFANGEILAGLGDGAIAVGEDAVVGITEAVHQIAEAPQAIGDWLGQGGAWIIDQVSGGSGQTPHQTHSILNNPPANQNQHQPERAVGNGR